MIHEMGSKKTTKQMKAMQCNLVVRPCTGRSAYVLEISPQGIGVAFTAVETEGAEGVAELAK